MMTVNQVIRKLEGLRDQGMGGHEAVIEVYGATYPIVYVEDTADGDCVEIATHTKLQLNK